MTERLKAKVDERAIRGECVPSIQFPPSGPSALGCKARQSFAALFTFFIEEPTGSGP